MGHIYPKVIKLVCNKADVSHGKDDLIWNYNSKWIATHDPDPIIKCKIGSAP